MELGIVRGRVVLLLRSAEIKPLFLRFVFFSLQEIKHTPLYFSSVIIVLPGLEVAVETVCF